LIYAKPLYFDGLERIKADYDDICRGIPGSSYFEYSAYHNNAKA
jgi:hypothetical protein